MAFFNRHHEAVPLNERYRCHYCGNKLSAVANSRGFYNIVCPVCGALTSTFVTVDAATKAGLNVGKVYDLERINSTYLQMSQVPEED